MDGDRWKCRPRESIYILLDIYLVCESVCDYVKTRSSRCTAFGVADCVKLWPSFQKKVQGLAGRDGQHIQSMTKTKAANPSHLYASYALPRRWTHQRGIYSSHTMTKHAISVDYHCTYVVYMFKRFGSAAYIVAHMHNDWILFAASSWCVCCYCTYSTSDYIHSTNAIMKTAEKTEHQTYSNRHFQFGFWWCSNPWKYVVNIQIKLIDLATRYIEVMPSVHVLHIYIIHALYDCSSKLIFCPPYVQIPYKIQSTQYNHIICTLSPRRCVALENWHI